MNLSRRFIFMTRVIIITISMTRSLLRIYVGTFSSQLVFKYEGRIPLQLYRQVIMRVMFIDLDDTTIAYHHRLTEIHVRFF